MKKVNSKSFFNANNCHHLEFIDFLEHRIIRKIIFLYTNG